LAPGVNFETSRTEKNGRINRGYSAQSVNVTPGGQILPLYEKLKTGANPTIVSYSGSDVKIHNATASLCVLKPKIFSSTLEKPSSQLQRWRFSCKFKSRRIGSRHQAYCRLQFNSKKIAKMFMSKMEIYKMATWRAPPH
jgi:hypothetical protein